MQPSTTTATTTTAIATVVITIDHCLGEGDWLDAAALARACRVEPGYIDDLVQEGLLEPPSTDLASRFGGVELARVRRIRRLQADFDASLPAVALMLDLIDEVDRLSGQLQRLGQRV